MNVSTHPDLDTLRRAERVPPPRRRRVGAKLFVVLLSLGVLGALYAVAKPLLFPPRTVRLATVRLVDGSAPMATPGGIVEDVGWLEAYPFPVTVRPLVSGVLERLDVLEGQAVEKDKTVIGVLRNLEIENAYLVAKADVTVREADLARATAVHAVAVSLVDQKLDLRERLAEIDGRLESARQDVIRFTAQRDEAIAAEDVARIDVEAQEELKRAGGDTPVALKRARARLTEASHKKTELGATIARAEADVARLDALRVIANEGIADPRSLQGDVDVAAAARDQAAAALESARVALGVAKTNVDHLIVRAPVDGVVMRLESAPGAVVGPQGEYKEGDESGPGSTSRLNRMTGTLVSIYDPAALQLRVDVLYGQVTNVQQGAEVTFTVDAIRGRTFHGTVHRLVHEADINQNALQAKIRVEDPDGAMRPEMLCRVRFEFPAGETPSAPGDGAPSRRLLVPSEAIRGGAVFVYDPTEGGRARRVPVAVLSVDGDWTAVQGPLGLSSKIILDVVEDGEKVEVGK